jgi:hypothetical protein
VATLSGFLPVSQIQSFTRSALAYFKEETVLLWHSLVCSTLSQESVHPSTGWLCPLSVYLTSLSQSLFQSICPFARLFDLRLLVPHEVNGFLTPLSHFSIALLLSFVLYFSLIVGLVSLLAAAFASFFHFGILMFW